MAKEVSLYDKLMDAQDKVVMIGDSVSAMGDGGAYTPRGSWFRGVSQTCEEIEEAMCDVLEFGEDCLKNIKDIKEG